MTRSSMFNLRQQFTALCCVGALLGFSACSTTSNAEGFPSSITAATTTVDTKPDTTLDTKPDTTAPETTVTTAPDTVPETIPDTTPDTTPDTAPALSISAEPINIEAIDPWPTALVGVGSSDGPDTAAAQQRLLQLGFWVGDTDGDYGFSTTQAVMAFQKYVSLPATGKLDQDTADWLTIFPEKVHGQADTGTLVEVDKTKQLLFIVHDGMTLWALNTSTGSGIAYTARNQKDPSKIESGDAVTPNGLWKVNRERPNGWWEGDLGDIYRPKYFRGGVAIHGMTRVPNKPVSHGCVRVSVAAMDYIWENNLVPLGTPVWVHE